MTQLEGIIIFVVSMLFSIMIYIRLDAGLSMRMLEMIFYVVMSAYFLHLAFKCSIIFMIDKLEGG